MSYYDWSRVVEQGISQGENGEYRYSTRYMIRATSSSVTRTQILLSGALPTYGTGSDENTSAVCVRADARRHPRSSLLWDGEAEWNTVTGNEDPSEKQLQPDLRRPQWSSTFIEVPQSFFYDLDGKRFCDTAGTPFSPPPEIPIEVEQITITKFEQTFSRSNDRAYIRATNTDVWQSAQAGEALLKNIETREVYEYGAYWFHRTYTVFVSPRILIPTTMAKDDSNRQIAFGGYDPIYVLNAGPRKKVFNAQIGKWEVVPIKHGNVADGQPSLLEDNGELLTLGDDGNPTTTQPPIYIAFRTVKKLAFSPLGLTPPWE